MPENKSIFDPSARPAPRVNEDEQKQNVESQELDAPFCRRDLMFLILGGVIALAVLLVFSIFFPL